VLFLLFRRYRSAALLELRGLIFCPLILRPQENVRKTFIVLYKSQWPSILSIDSWSFETQRRYTPMLGLGSSVPSYVANFTGWCGLLRYETLCSSLDLEK